MQTAPAPTQAGWSLLAATLLLASAWTVPALHGQSSEQRFAELRQRMVEEQLKHRGIKQPEVLDAMAKVPRHRFVPDEYQERAYDDSPLPIGWGQTISQPYMVALMTQALELEGGETVLEIGTGSGYQSAVLSPIAGRVYTIEIIEHLGRQAARTLVDLGYSNVQVRIGDGYKGWPEAAPFDAVIITAAPPRIPEPLVEQLRPGGRMVLPVGEFFQDLLLVTKAEDGTLQKKKVAAVRFVPMTGEVREE
jgi:protein-L-isoaspartate(D-aspartate) O-methyltransferase